MPGTLDSTGKKGSVLINLFLDMLFSNDETKGIYFSLDDSKDIIIDRMIAYLTGANINTVKRKQIGAIQQEIKEAYDNLIDYAESGRLLIKDISEIRDINQLELEIHFNAGENLFYQRC